MKEKENHQAEIINSRKGGFGGSDAAMFYKVGLKGLSSLSETDKRRIAVAMGLIPYVPIAQNAAMSAGHEFEQLVAEHTMEEAEEYEVVREYKMTNEAIKPNNFDIFAHADFYSMKTGDVNECKYSQKMTGEVVDVYYSQLQWYYMLGASKVYLKHGWGEIYPQLGVASTRTKHIIKDEKHIAILINGIKLIDELCNDYTYTKPEEVGVEDLTTFEQKEVMLLTSILSEINEATKRAEDVKARMLQMMSIYGIKSIKSDAYSITYFPPSEAYTFDKAKLLKDHPEINEADYLKASKKKEFIKISLK